MHAKYTRWSVLGAATLMVAALVVAGLVLARGR